MNLIVPITLYGISHRNNYFTTFTPLSVFSISTININLYIQVFVRLAFSHTNHRYFIDYHFISYMFMTLSLSYDIRVTFQVTLTSYHTFNSLYYHLHVVVFIGKFQGRYSFHSLLSLPVLLNILGLNLFS